MKFRKLKKQIAFLCLLTLGTGQLSLANTSAAVSEPLVVSAETYAQIKAIPKKRVKIYTRDGFTFVLVANSNPKVQNDIELKPKTDRYKAAIGIVAVAVTAAVITAATGARSNYLRSKKLAALKKFEAEHFLAARAEEMNNEIRARTANLEKYSGPVVPPARPVGIPAEDYYPTLKVTLQEAQNRLAATKIKSAERIAHAEARIDERINSSERLNGSDQLNGSGPFKGLNKNIEAKELALAALDNPAPPQIIPPDQLALHRNKLIGQRDRLVAERDKLASNIVETKELRKVKLEKRLHGIPGKKLGYDLKKRSWDVERKQIKYDRKLAERDAFAAKSQTKINEMQKLISPTSAAIPVLSDAEKQQRLGDLLNDYKKQKWKGVYSWNAITAGLFSFVSGAALSHLFRDAYYEHYQAYYTVKDLLANSNDDATFLYMSVKDFRELTPEFEAQGFSIPSSIEVAAEDADEREELAEQESADAQEVAGAQTNLDTQGSADTQNRADARVSAEVQHSPAVQEKANSQEEAGAQANSDTEKSPAAGENADTQKNTDTQDANAQENSENSATPENPAA